MKRWMSSFLVLCILFSMLPMSTIAVSAQESALYLGEDRLGMRYDATATTTPPTLSPSFGNIEPYTIGSNQEWALWALSQLDNSTEKIRLYNFLLRAHTYLLIYDDRDYTDEYYFVKNQWLSFLEEIPCENVRLMLDDENWTIDIWYPLESPFQLSCEEFLQTYLYFLDANPQFFLSRIVPVTMHCDAGLTPGISISAYWAFANRRQEAYNNIQNTFDAFKFHLENTIDTNNQFHVVRYVYGHVIEALNYNYEITDYVSRATLDMDSTILGYFSNARLTICKGYATVMMYLLNRLGIPTIDQGGAMIIRDYNGNIVDHVLHAWNIVKLNNEWYFMDATWEISSEYTDWDWFLKGRGENNDSHFLHYHAIAEDMIYPEVAIADFCPDTSPNGGGPTPELWRQAFMVGRATGSGEPNRIAPQANITRAEVATIFFRLITDEMRTKYWMQTNPFSDVALERWFNNAISTTFNMGLFDWVGDCVFAPDQGITRGELVAVLVQFMNVGGNSIAESNDQFSDIKEHWARTYINEAARNGWIRGYTDGTFRPNQDITRAETAAMINRLLQRLVETADCLLDDMISFPDNQNQGAWYYLYIYMAANSYTYRWRDDNNTYKELIEIIDPRDWSVLEGPFSRPEHIR